MGLLQKISKLDGPKSEVKITPLTSTQALPIPAYQFSIEIGSDTVALFQKVSGMSVKRDIDPLTVGGMNNCTYEFPGHISYGHITLETGLTSSDFFWNWMTAGQYDGWSYIKHFTLVQRRPNKRSPRPTWEEVRRWNFINAFPVSWRIGDLSQGDASSIVIESLELSFDFFEAGQV